MRKTREITQQMQFTMPKRQNVNGFTEAEVKRLQEIRQARKKRKINLDPRRFDY